MKKLSLLAALAGVSLAASAFAYTPKESIAKTNETALKIYPAKVVSPVGVPRRFVNAVVNVEFTVDAAGQPRDIKVLKVSDQVLKEQLVQAFSQWRFEGAVSEASGTNKHFILPIEIRAES